MKMNWFRIVRICLALFFVYLLIEFFAIQWLSFRLVVFPFMPVFGLNGFFQSVVVFTCLLVIYLVTKKYVLMNHPDWRKRDDMSIGWKLFKKISQYVLTIVIVSIPFFAISFILPMLAGGFALGCLGDGPCNPTILSALDIISKILYLVYVVWAITVFSYIVKLFNLDRKGKLKRGIFSNF